MNFAYLLVRRGDETLLDFSSQDRVSLPRVARRAGEDPVEALERFLRKIAIVRRPGTFRKVDAASFEVFELVDADIYVPGYSWCALRSSPSFDPVVTATLDLEKAPRTAHAA